MALEEYRSSENIMRQLHFSGYWASAAAESAAANGAALERLAMEELVADIERRHGARVEEVAAAGPRRGQRIHVLDPYWVRADVQRDGQERREEERSMLSDMDDLMEEERADMYDRFAFERFMSYA